MVIIVLAHVCIIIRGRDIVVTVFVHVSHTRETRYKDHRM